MICPIDIPPHIRGLVFDCDGTVVDTMPLHYQAFRITFRRYYNCDMDETVFYDLAGVPTVRITEILNEKHGYALPVPEAAHRKEAAYQELIPQARVVEPVADLIRRCTGKLPMAVATGGNRENCVKALQAVGLIHHFQAIVTAADVAHPKPAPDIFLEAARRLSVAPELCYAFEDGDLGLQAASAAGMKAIDIRPWLKQ